MKSKNLFGKLFISRDFGLLWMGQAVSIFGNFFMYLALPIMTYNITGSTITLGITISLQAVPAIIAGPFAGALVDRWDRKKTMYISDILRGLILLPIILIQGSDKLYAVYSVSFLLSLVGVFFEPAFGAAVPKIAGKDNVLKANSLMQTTVSIVKILAPLAGAAVLATAGPAVLIGVDIASFAVSALTIIFIKANIKVDSENKITVGTIVEDVKDGVRYIMKLKVVRTVLIAFLFLAFFEGIIEVLMLPYIKDILKAGEQGFSYAIAIQGAGQILGSVVISFIGKKMSTEKLFMLSMGCLAILVVPFVNLGNFIAVLPVICTIGIVTVGLFISANTIIQSTVEDKYMGRVENSLGILFQTGMLMTTLLAGTMSEIYGIQLILNIGAGIEIVGAIITVSMLRVKKGTKKLAVEGE
jgi:MFS family permease